MAITAMAPQKIIGFFCSSFPSDRFMQLMKIQPYPGGPKN